MRVKLKYYIVGFIFFIIMVVTIVLFVFNAKQNNEDKIKIVLDWTPNTNHTGLYVAKELNYFSDEGLDVEIIQPPQGNATMLVATGKAQFGIDFQDYLAPALSRKNPLPVTVIAAICQHNTMGILSRKRAKIHNLEDMLFKNYATYDDPIEQGILKNIFKKNDLDFNKLNLIHSFVENILVSFEKDVDAVLAYYGWDKILADTNNISNNFMFLPDLDNVLDYYTPVIIANNNYLSDNEVNTIKFMKAVYKGYNYAISRPIEAAKILSKFTLAKDENFLLKSQEYISSQYKAEAEFWGTIKKDRWENFYYWLYENKIIDFEIKEGTSFTNYFLERAIDGYGTISN